MTKPTETQSVPVGFMLYVCVGVGNVFLDFLQFYSSARASAQSVALYMPDSMTENIAIATLHRVVDNVCSMAVLPDDGVGSCPAATFAKEYVESIRQR